MPIHFKFSDILKCNFVLKGFQLSAQIGCSAENGQETLTQTILCGLAEADYFKRYARDNKRDVYRFKPQG